MNRTKTFLGVVLSVGLLTAQNVGIGTSSPHASARLHVYDTERGVLIPNVLLSAQNSISPIVNPPGPEVSLLVYNTATAGSGANAVSPGYYYWNGNRWVRLLTGTNGGGEAWLTTGNANTTAGTHFVGTTDAQALDFRTNNIIRFRIPTANQVYAMADGTAGAPFYSWNSATNSGLYRGSSGEIGISVGGTYRFTVGAYNGSIGGSNRIPCCARIAGVAIVDFYQPVEIGNDGGNNLQATLGYWRGMEVEISPEQNAYGYVGFPNVNLALRNAWWGMATYNFTNYSGRDEKKNIVRINENSAIEHLVMQDIERMQPCFYNYTVESDVPRGKHDLRYRKHYHVGVIVDEAPDYIKDASLSGIDVYGIGTLALAGVKATAKRLRRAEETLKEVPISDFGSVTCESQEVFVRYSDAFKEKLGGTVPVVFITPVGVQEVKYRVVEKNAEGFRIVFERGSMNSSITFDWIALAKVKSDASLEFSLQQVDPTTLGKMHLTEAERKLAIDNYNVPPSPAAKSYE